MWRMQDIMSQSHSIATRVFVRRAIYGMLDSNSGREPNSSVESTKDRALEQADAWSKLLVPLAGAGVGCSRLFSVA